MCFNLCTARLFLKLCIVNSNPLCHSWAPLGTFYLDINMSLHAAVDICSFFCRHNGLIISLAKVVVSYRIISRMSDYIKDPLTRNVKYVFKSMHVLRLM